MSIFYPDTSTIMSLFDETEPLHNRAKDILRQYKIMDVFVSTIVQTEWQSRTMREHRELVLKTIVLIDAKKGKEDSMMTATKFNVLVDNAANIIRSKPTIESRKLDRARANLQKEIARSFNSISGAPVTSRSIDYLKEQIIRINYAFYEKGQGVIGFFIRHGYRHPGVNEDVDSAVKQFLSEHETGLETQDSMVLADLLRYAASDSNNYDFVVGDKNFYKKGKEYIKLYDDVASRVKFKLLSAP